MISCVVFVYLFEGSLRIYMFLYGRFFLLCWVFILFCGFYSIWFDVLVKNSKMILLLVSCNVIFKCWFSLDGFMYFFRYFDSFFFCIFGLVCWLCVCIMKLF